MAARLTPHNLAALEHMLLVYFSNLSTISHLWWNDVLKKAICDLTTVTLLPAACRILVVTKHAETSLQTFIVCGSRNAVSLVRALGSTEVGPYKSTADLELKESFVLVCHCLTMVLPPLQVDLKSPLCRQQSHASSAQVEPS